MGNNTIDNRESSIMRITLWGAVINCVLTAFKIAAGIVGNSSAMVADGIHSLSDLVSDFIVVVFVRISSKGQDKKHDYGHGKFETLSTLIVSVLLLLVGIKLFLNGADYIKRHLNGEVLPQPGMIALYMAIVSIVTKEILYQMTARVGRNVNSQAVIANAWHHRSDAISSVGSLIGIAGAIFLGSKWVILDPIMGCIISMFIFYIAMTMGKTAISELMEASLPEREEEEITQLIASVEGIKGVHNLKTRRNGQSVIIDVHVVVSPNITVIAAHEMTVAAERLLTNRFGDSTQIFIHVEPHDAAL
ncbi:MAG: cation diffusion facilitator family transporter [Prevotella sp.]|uniref:cation diffusion facilitator family transporter n=1 Tax=Prevotella sp. TaxID=59823 RepID=UPI002A2C4E29|nr:cation diffusion facilitator family transporter [Prevotella sp.]MDD7318266.1 cation diffusion facilitator family transporter [Prevotellaceae bacterium]MDY4019730.1 cation diffusion facilitator family transporter [Prevotella sp.]